MSIFMSSLYLLIFSLSLVAIPTKGTTLEDLCKNINGAGYVDYETCMTNLGPDPRSGTAADFPAVPRIAIDLCVANATSVKSRVVKLVPDQKYASVKAALDVFLSLYSNVIPALKWSSDAIASKDYTEAEAALSDALGLPTACDEAFTEKGDFLPLSDDNNKFSVITLIARTIATLRDSM